MVFPPDLAAILDCWQVISVATGLSMTLEILFTVVPLVALRVFNSVFSFDFDLDFVLFLPFCLSCDADFLPRTLEMERDLDLLPLEKE